MDSESPVERVESFVLSDDLDEEEESSVLELQVERERTRALLQAAAEIRLSDPALALDEEARAKLEKLLEAAGLDNSIIEPDVLDRLTSSVSCALDEAAAALTRMRQDALIDRKLQNHNHNSSSSQARSGSPSSLVAGLTNSRTKGVISSSSSRPAIVEDIDSDAMSLIDACNDGDLDAVRRLLEEGRNVNETTDEGESLLSLACSSGYLELAQLLLATRANVEDRGLKDTTPLMEAASAGHVDIVRLLLDHGADVNAQTTQGNTPLMYAASGCTPDHETIVRYLLDSGANVSDCNENGHTPLMEAASAGNVEVAKILVEAGASINTHSNEFKESALTLACYKGHLEMVRFLLDAGADQEHKTEEMHTALMEASMDGHVEVARLLLDSGAQVNMPADSFESPLTLAACGGHVELAMLLLERGANIEEVNDEGYTPLMEAAREGHEDMVGLLLSQGADINAQTEETQETALTLACCGGFIEVADFLIKAGADIEAGANTPLAEAAQEGHLELVKHLLDAKANVNATSATGDTPLMYACENGHTEVAEVLLEAGANIEHEAEGGRSPLMKAARAGHLTTVQFLVSRGANVNKVTSSNDHTPLSLACAGGHMAVVEYLLANGADSSHRLKDNSNMLIEAAKGGHTQIVQLLIEHPLHSSPLPSADSSPALPPLSSCVANANINPDASGRGESAITSTNDGQGTPSVTGKVTSKSSTVTTSNKVPGPASRTIRKPIQQAPSSTVPPPAAGEESEAGVDAEMALKETERLEQCINNMMKRTEMLNPSREEQILQKQQILEELQRVERELQSKAQAQLLLSAQATAHQQQQQQLLQALASETITREAGRTVATYRFPLSDFMFEGDKEPPPPSGATPPVKRIAKAKKKTFPMKITTSDLEETLNQKNINDTLGTNVQVPDVSSTTQQQQVESAKSFPPPPPMTGGDEAPSDRTQVSTTSQSTQTPPVSLSSATGGSSVMSITSTLTTESGSTVKLNLVSGSTKGGQGNGAPPSGSMLQLPPLTTQQLQVLKKQLADAAAAAASGQVGFDGSVTIRPQTSPNQASTDESSSKSLSDPGVGASSSSSSASSVTGGTDVRVPQRQVPRVPPGPPGASVASQTILDRNMLDNLRQQYGKSVSSSSSSSSSSSKSISISNNNQQVCSSSSSSSVVSGQSNVTSNTTSSSVPSPPPFFSQSIEIDGQTDSNHDTALTVSCAGGHEELVMFLLSRGANCEHRDKKGFTPLMLAATAGHTNVCDQLLNHGVEIEAQSERTKDTALSLACSSGRYEVVELLLSRGANKEHRNVSDYTPLSLAASGGYVNIIKLLLQHGAEINSRTGSKLGISPLMLAAMNGHAQTVKLLLDMGSDINAQIETNRNTALTLACFQGRCEVVSLLLDRKANVEHRAKTGLTPLMEAASGGYVEVGRILLDKGADVNAPPVPSSRDTALTIAADKGHYRFVELLIKKGGSCINLDARNKKGSSPLWLSANGGHLDVVQLLVTSGADIDAQDNRKVSCLMAAFRKGHLKVVKWMVKHVSQFPSDQEMTRYLTLVNDKELLKKCNQCMEFIRQAKDKQAAEANKNAAILLEELEKERSVMEKKKEKQAKKKERQKQNKKAKQEEKEKDKKAKTKGSSEDKKASGQNQIKNESSDSESEDDESDDEDSSNLPAPDDSRVSQPPPSVTIIPVTGRKSSKPDVVTSPVKEPTTKATTKMANKKQKQSVEVIVVDAPQPVKAPKTATVTTKASQKKETPVVTIEAVTAKGTNKKEDKKAPSVPATTKAQKIEKVEKPTVQTQVSKEEKKRPQKVEVPVVESNVWTNETAANLNGRDGHSKKAAKGRSLSPQPTTTTRRGGHSTTTVTSTSQVKVLRCEEDLGWQEVTRGQKRIRVPANAISRVIGRAGCNINMVREYSGAHIEVEKQKEKVQEQFRLITLKGSGEAMKNAHAMISALVNEPDKELAEIVAALGLDDFVKEDDQSGPRSKSGSISVSSTSKTMTAKSLASSQPMSSMVFSSTQLQASTTTVFSSPKTTAKQSTTPFATNWTNVPVTTTSNVTGRSSAKITNTPPTSSPIKHPASSTSPDIKQSSSPFTNVRPASQPFPSKSPGPPAVSQQNSTTSEYTPFTNSLFPKVGPSVWGSKDQKLNFAAVARGSTASTNPPSSSSATSALTIQASSNITDVSGPVAEPSKAPGFRGNFVSPTSSTGSPSTVTSQTYSSAPGARSAPCSPPIVGNQQQPLQQVSNDDSGRNDHFRSHESKFNLAPGSRVGVSQGSPSSQHIEMSDTSVLIDDFRGDYSGSSSLNPNAQSYAPDAVGGMPHSRGGVLPNMASRSLQQMSPGSGRPSSGSLPFQSIPNPDLQQQMKVALLAAGSALQQSALEQQRLRQQQQQQQQAAQAAMMAPDVPSAETLRMLQMALQGAAAASAGSFSNVSASSTMSAGMNSYNSGHPVNPSVIGPPRRKMDPQEGPDMNQLASSMLEEAKFPRPIGTERAQKKNPIGPYGLNTGLNNPDVWPMNDLPFEPEWPHFTGPMDPSLMANLQAPLPNRSFDAGFIDPVLDSFQLSVDQGYSVPPSSGLMPNLLNGSLPPTHGLGSSSGFSTGQLQHMTPEASMPEYWTASHVQQNWKPMTSSGDADDQKKMSWHSTTNQTSQHHPQSWTHHQ